MPALFSRLDRVHSRPLDPITGGFCIRGAQLASIILAKSPVGVSTGHEIVGKLFWRGLDALRGKTKKHDRLPTITSLMFGAGIMVCSWTLMHLRPEFGVLVDTESILPTRVLLGGIAMVVRARIAGGCTSGHGITGMAMLCTSSVLTVISMFAGGISLSAVI